MLRAAVLPMNTGATRFTARGGIGFASPDGAVGVTFDRSAVATRLLVQLSSRALSTRRSHSSDQKDHRQNRIERFHKYSSIINSPYDTSAASGICSCSV
jgi:hypothetical protein